MTMLAIALTLFLACYILEERKGQKQQDLIDDAFIQDWIDQKIKEERK